MKLWMKAAISAALMALLLWQVDVKEIVAVVREASLPLCLVAFGLFLFQQAVVTYCWQILLTSNGDEVPFTKTLEVHFVGSFFGTFLPSSIGMDLIRAFQLGRYLGRGVDAASTMFVTRVVGFLMNFLLALIVAMPFSYQIGDMRIFWAVLVTTIAFLIAIFLILNRYSLQAVRRLLRTTRFAGVIAKLEAFRTGIFELAKNKSITIALIMLSLFYQVLGVIIIYVIGIAVGIELGIWHYFIYIPLITTITVLPISLAGIGVREESFVFFFTLAGVAGAKALSLSLLVFAQTLGLALLGGIWYFLAKENREATVGAQ